MWWRLIFLAVAAAAEEEHFLDVKQIVKGTIEAVAKLPMGQQNVTVQDHDKNPEDFYRLFQLPADIMTKLAADAGYLEKPQSTTDGPWIVRRKVHKSSDEEQEGGKSFDQDDSDEERPRRKKKHWKDPTLISIRELLSNVDKIPPAATASSASLPTVPIPTGESQQHMASLPIVESATDLTHSNVQPQYAYQPIVQPDGKTYYQQVLIVPGQVVSSDPAPVLHSASSLKSSFVQEQPPKPKNIVQADFSVAAPTFPPPVEVFKKYDITHPSTPMETTPRSSIYPTRYVKWPSSPLTPRRIQVPQSDPIAIPSSRSSTEEPQKYETQNESLYTTKLPTNEEQRRRARVFHEEAIAPPKQMMKTVQESPLRIRTVDSHVEQASSSETKTLRQLKHGDELKKALERHRLEIELPPPARKRKVRKMKKSKKLSKVKFVDDEIGRPSVHSTSEEFRETVRRMPEKQYLHNVPILSSPVVRRHERAHASKTWRKRKYEPLVDEVVVKHLESIEEKKDEADDEVTEPPKKRRRTQRISKSKKTRKIIDYSEGEASRSKSKEEFEQLTEEPETSTPVVLKRKILRLNRFSREPENSEPDVEEGTGTRRFRSRSKKMKKTRSRRTKSSKSSHPESSPLRQHCLNIRTFARQFGIADIEEFSQEHCAFIENYYPNLTCERRSDYVAECRKYF